MKIIHALAMLVCVNSFAQEEIDSAIAKKSNELRNDKIDDFFYFEKYCIGGIRLVKNGEIDCFIENSKVYVFWKESSKSYVQRLGDCETSKLEIPNDLTYLFVKNKNTIETEKVEGYRLKNGGWRIVSHSCFKKISFYQNSNLITNRFDEFDLSSDEKDPNVNSKTNKKLKLVLLAEYCEQILKEKGI